MPSQIKYPSAASEISVSSYAWSGLSNVYSSNSTGASQSSNAVGGGYESGYGGEQTGNAAGNKLRTSSYGFTVPNLAAINGVEITVRYKAIQGEYNGNYYSGIGYPYEILLTLSDSTTAIGTARNGETLTADNTWRTTTYGGQTNKLGVTNLTPSLVNSSNFGVQYQLDYTYEYGSDCAFYDLDAMACTGGYTSWAANGSIEIDYIAIEVFYTENSGFLMF